MEARGEGREGKGGRAGGSTVEKREMAKLHFFFFLFSDWVFLGDWCSWGGRRSFSSPLSPPADDLHFLVSLLYSGTYIITQEWSTASR